ncbi:MAG TPA: DUF3084 domain-containing protein [Candidatus Sulfotelmatobacter sp.]|nr:DUF3084 domain-containing protein [Candidatus Sulfotelmatobacter sp.]
MIFPFAAQLIILLLLIGGAIAYIGNYVGKYFGKRRLTVFNLRPRHTAMLITVISGILIALSTLMVLLAVSQDARTAFLGLDKLKEQIALKTAEFNAANEALQLTLAEQQALAGKLTGAKKEIGQLLGAKKKLSKEVAAARQGEVVFKKGEVISISLIQAGPDKGKLEAGLRQIIAGAEENLRTAGLKSRVDVPADELEQTLYALLNESKRYVAKLVAGRNVVWGEDIPAAFDLAENALVYKLGDEITGGDIPSGSSQPQIEQAIMRLLALSRQVARDAGVLPDVSGSLGSVSYASISDLAKKIKTGGKKVRLKVLAKKDIYVVGPLDVDLKISYQ